MITIYTNQISTVEGKTSVGPAASLHALVGDSSNRGEKFHLSSTEPRGPQASQLPQYHCLGNLGEKVPRDVVGADFLH
jgi:hypothetical protein